MRRLSALLLLSGLAAVAFLAGCSSPPDTMPNVVGMKLDKAKEALDGLNVETTDASGQDRSVWEPANWTVEYQNIEPGFQLTGTETIELKINKQETRSSGGSVSAAGSRYPAPVVLGTLTFAESKNPGITFDAHDVGQHIVDGVDHERAVWDRGNWQIAAYCDDVVDGTLKVGVIKVDEFAAISQAGQGTIIAENGLKGALSCP
ncbi:MAG: PASTA domain-containing protein [Nocardiaceae bacterium]|nr:PASTA domain-containing protein [Nocardiaceae bacterium]